METTQIIKFLEGTMAKILSCRFASATYDIYVLIDLLKEDIGRKEMSPVASEAFKIGLAGLGVK